MELYNFFETDQFRWVRWTAVLLLICVGVGMFLWNLDDIRTCEQISREPMLVEAVIHVELDSPHYNQYLTYTCEGVTYEGVLYRSAQNPGYMEDDGKTVTISVDPRDPGVLAENILNTEVIEASILMTAIGVALAVYALMLRSERFRRWRCRRAGKDRPEYLMDMALLTALCNSGIYVIPACLFPLVFVGTFFGSIVLCFVAVSLEWIVGMAGRYNR